MDKADFHTFINFMDDKSHSLIYHIVGQTLPLIDLSKDT